MTSLQNLTAQINDVLDGGRPQPDGDLGRVASQYAELSAQANFRLRRCVDLLRKGLRSEAVHEAETEPELFNLLRSLDLKRLEDWDRLCAENGLDRPRPLLIEGVRALNDAIAEEKRLLPLLRRHRELALARGPLADRIDVLRRLREADGRNPVWAEDVRALETERLREIESLLRSGAHPQELAWCNALFAELADARWLVKPSAAVVREARRVLTEAQRRWAAVELRKLLPAMHEAQGAWDAAACDRLLGRWREVMLAAGMGEGDLPAELREQWKPIADWSAAQAAQREAKQQFEAASHELRRAMEGPANLDELSRLYESVRRFEQTADEGLERDYQRLVSSLRLAQARRRRAGLATVTAAVLVVACVVGVAAHDLLAERAADRRASEAVAAAERGDVATAETRRGEVAGWQPMVLARERWRSSLASIDDGLRAAAERDAAFAAAMGRVDAAGAAGVTVAMLDEADRFARGDEERQRVAEARAAHAEHERREQEERDAATLERIRAAAERIAGIDEATLRDRPRKADAALRAVEAELAAARAASEGRARVRAALGPVESSAAALRSAVDHRVAEAVRQEAESAALEAIGAQGYLATALVGELERFVQKFPDSPHAEGFTEAVELSGAWQAVEAWAGLVSGWQGELRPAGTPEAAKRLRDVQDYLARHAASPLRARIEPYQRYLEAVVLLAMEEGTTPEHVPWRQQVRDLLKTPVMTELNMVQTMAGDRYYTVGDGKYREDSLGIHIELALTPDLTQLTEMVFSTGAVGKPAPSPQKALARQVTQLLRAGDPADAEVNALRVAGAVVADDAVDAILRALLVTRLADGATEAGGSLGKDLGAWVDPLRGFDLAQANWMNGGDADAKELRAVVSAALKALPALQARIDAVLARNAAAIAGAKVELIGRGVLLERDGKRVVDGLDAVGDAALWAMSRRPSGAELTRIGAVRSREVTLDEAMMYGVPEGSMVFAMPLVESR